MSDNRMQNKIRLAQEQKVPYMLVLGDREVEARTVAPRARNAERGEQQDADPLGRVLPTAWQPRAAIGQSEPAPARPVSVKRGPPSLMPVASITRGCQGKCPRREATAR